jgi:hypothetical protein
MKRFTDEELLGFLGDIESDRVERKKSFKGDTPDRARQAICAFANDLPNHNEPGVLFIGADDDGTPSGEPVTDERILNERRRYKDIPYDLHPFASASLSDLSRVHFEYEYLPAAFARLRFFDIHFLPPRFI